MINKNRNIFCLDQLSFVIGTPHYGKQCSRLDGETDGRSDNRTNLFYVVAVDACGVQNQQGFCCAYVDLRERLGGPPQTDGLMHDGRN